jgi:D-alanyl-D-alanine dipeptidase
MVEAADADTPSVARIAAELVTFLFPLPEEAMRRIADDFGSEAASFFDPLVAVSDADPTIEIDSRYATPDNCAKQALYPAHMRRQCFVRRSVATQLRHAQTALHRQGYGLKI